MQVMRMREFSVEACVACLLFLLLSLAGACERFGNGAKDACGRLCISFDAAVSNGVKSGMEMPDTSDFMLTIRDARNNLIYDGLFGDCPESLTVPSGSYVVSAVSRDFDRPEFNAPQFGDEQCVVVPADGKVGVRLKCGQLNAGVTLDVSADFLTSCPDAVLFLKSSTGKLMYSYSERRVAYFLPGQVSLVMSDDKGETLLMTADLQARDMLKIKVSVAESLKVSSKGIVMDIDTSRVWRYGECTVGGEKSGVTEDVLTVAQARNSAGKKEVWVSGYIVGGNLTSASASFEPPFKSKTNILVGPRSSTVERDACVSVQLPEGKVRDALNLVDNPDMLRRKVMIKGDVVDSYFGLPGIKNTIDYQLF